MAEAVDEVEVDEGGGGVAVGGGLGEVSGDGVHLLAELGVAGDGFDPLLHEVVELGLLAVVGHPAGSAEGGEGLGGSGPDVAWPGGGRGGSVVGGIVLGDGGEGVGRPEGFGVVDLAGPDGVEDGFVFGVVALKDVLAEDAGDDVAADADELVLGVEIVEGGVFGAVEFFDDEGADGLGVLVPAGGFVAFAEGGGHVGEGDASAVGSGGEIRAEARHGGDGRALAGIGVGAAVGDSGPAGGVVVSGVVGAEAFDESGFAGVAELAEPCVPAGAGVVGGDEELVVVGELDEIPGGGGDGDDHLDLAVAAGGADVVGELDGGGELSGGVAGGGQLLAEEGHVVIAGDPEGFGFGGGGRDVLREGAVDEAFLGGALLPDAGVFGTFDEDGSGKARHNVEVSGEDGEGGLPGAEPAGIRGGEGGRARSGGCLRESGRGQKCGGGGEGAEVEKFSALKLFLLKHIWQQCSRFVERR